MSYWDDLMYSGCNKRRRSSNPNKTPIETRRFKIRRSSSSSSSSSSNRRYNRGRR